MGYPTYIVATGERGPGEDVLSKICVAEERAFDGA